MRSLFGEVVVIYKINAEVSVARSLRDRAGRYFSCEVLVEYPVMNMFPSGGRAGGDP